MHGQYCIDRGKKIFIESQVIFKVTKCNTDTIPHASRHHCSALEIWQVQKQRMGSWQTIIHIKQKKNKTVLKYSQLLETVKKITEQKVNISKNREAASMYKVSDTQNISRLLIHRDCFWSRDI